MNKLLIILGIIALLLILYSYESQALSGVSSNYRLTHGNINYVTGHNNSTNYIQDMSVVQQPTLNSESTNFLAYLGFYFSGIIDFLEDEIGWWFLAIVFALMSIIYILYHTLKTNKFMKIPISIGIILLLIILLDVILLGLDVFAGSTILASISGIVELFLSIITRLLPFIFIIWCVFFIVYMINSIKTKNKF